MTRDERRRDRDPIWWQQVRARLARIKVAMAAKRTNELMATMPRNTNWMETELLRQQRKDSRK